MPAWTANFPPLWRIQVSWSQCSIGHWPSRHSPHLWISFPVWTSNFPPFPLAMPTWTADFPPLRCIQLLWSQCSIGHWPLRLSPHSWISLPVWTSDFPPYLFAMSTWTADFPLYPTFVVLMLNWTLAFPLFPTCRSINAYVDIGVHPANTTTGNNGIWLQTLQLNPFQQQWKVFPGGQYCYDEIH